LFTQKFQIKQAGSGNNELGTSPSRLPRRLLYFSLSIQWHSLRNTMGSLLVVDHIACDQLFRTVADGVHALDPGEGARALRDLIAPSAVVS
jgi:hypothetical protein